MTELVELFEQIRTLLARLRKACCRLKISTFSPAHTTGAGWDTVALTLLPGGVGPQDIDGPGRLQPPQDMG